MRSLSRSAARGARLVAFALAVRASLALVVAVLAELQWPTYGPVATWVVLAIVAADAVATIALVDGATRIARLAPS